jgi:hypothetical protein
MVLRWQFIVLCSSEIKLSEFSNMGGSYYECNGSLQGNGKGPTAALCLTASKAAVGHRVLSDG